MANRTRTLLPLLALSLILAAPSARAAGLSIWATGGANDGATDFTSPSGTRTKTGFGFGGGLLVDLHVLRGVALETGALYLTNSFDVTAGGTTTSSSTGSLYVPADLRLRIFGPVSISGGLYYDAFSSVSAPDHGWEASVRLSNWVWFLEGRYLHGLQDHGDGLTYNSFLFLLGFRL